MLTLKHILASSRMMHQYRGQYRGFHEDHVPEYFPENFFRGPISPAEEAVVLNLGYEAGPDGGLRIVQK